MLIPYRTHDVLRPKMATGVSPDPVVRKADPLSDVDEERFCSRYKGS